MSDGLDCPESWGEPEFCVCVANGGSALVINYVTLCIDLSALTMSSSGTGFW